LLTFYVYIIILFDPASKLIKLVNNKSRVRESSTIFLLLEYKY